MSSIDYNERLLSIGVLFGLLRGIWTSWIVQIPLKILILLNIFVTILSDGLNGNFSQG